MASNQPTVRLPAAVPTLLLLLAFSANTTSAETGGFLSIPELPDLQARISAFRQALRDVTVEPVPLIPESPPSSGDVLILESRYRFLESLGRPSLDEHPGLPGRRDLVFEEQWLLAGREQEHEDAARHWLGRRLKGSDHRVRSGRAPVQARASWDHGPLVGLGHGPLSVRAGESQWRLQWSKRWARSGGPWRSHAWVGEEDGEFRAEFLIGRTLLDSYGR